MRQLVACHAGDSPAAQPEEAPMRTALSALRRMACAWAALIFIAGAARAADFRLGEVTIAEGPVKLTASSVEMRGSSLSREAAERLMGAPGGEPLAARLAGLSIARAEIPQLTLEITLFGQKMVWRYRNVALAEIREGLIGEASSERGEGHATDSAGGGIAYEWGQTRLQRLDVAALASVVGGIRPAGEPPKFRQIIASARVENFVQRQAGLTATQAANSWSGLSLSPGLKPWGERIALLGDTMMKSMAAEKAGDPAPRPEPAALADMLSLLEDIRFGTNEIERMKVTFAADKVKGLEEAGELSIRRIATVDTGDIAANSAVAQDVAGAFGEARFSLREISLKGFSAAAAVSSLRASMAAGKADAIEDDIAKLIPTIGRFSATGLEIDMPARPGASPGTPAIPATHISLGAFEFHVRAQEKGAPSDIRLAMERLSVPVPREDASSRPLLDLGYTRLEASSRIDLGWNRERKEIGIRELGFEALDMVNVAMSATIGNAGEDLFASDLALMQVAALGLNLQSFRLNLDNLGLFDRVLQAEARKAGREPAALRRDWGALAAIALPAMLGDSPAAKTLAGAVARFIASPRSLTISATAPPGGIGLADVIAAGDPKAVLGRLDIKADTR
jgi:hypothetical protein